MEFDIVQIRILLLLMMLCITGILDFKTRKIPDMLWLIFGGAGAVLYIWDYHTITPYHIIAILTSSFVGVAIWKWRIAGLADCFAMIAMAVILPVHYEFVMMPIMTLIMAFFIVIIGTMMYNISMNLSEMIRIKNWVFSEFKSESKYKKAFAFLVLHRKRKQERFVISAEKNSEIKSDSKRFVFLSSKNKITRDNQIQQMKQSNRMYVQNVPPLITFLFGVALLLLLPEILSIIF